MGTVVVFGAGASLANAEHFAASEPSPPLDRTFFAKILELEIPVPEDLDAYASALPAGSPFEHSASALRMEEFFKQLFYDFSNEGEREPAVAAAYTSLVDLYRRVISETTDWMTEDDRRGGPVGRLIQRTVRSSDFVTLLTFNQDLVLENEIHKSKPLRRLWCIEHGYGTFSQHVSMLRRNSGSGSFDNHSKACNGGKRLKILKMHGSLNWQVRMNGRQPSQRILAGDSRAPAVQVTRRRRIPNQLRFARRTEGRGRTRWYMWPVLVPPIHNKQALIRRFLPQVWADAQEALLECDRLVLYGYSLPPTDIEAEMLFGRSIFRNAALDVVDVINPDPDSAGRYARLVPSKPMRWYPEVSTFLAELPTR
jgi:hypothetical protein